MVCTRARRARSNTTSDRLPRCGTSTRFPSGVNFTRKGALPPLARRATTLSVRTSMTEMRPLSTLAAHTSAPSGETARPISPGWVRMKLTRPRSRSMTLNPPPSR
jgi:hypothetical protein